MRHTIELGSYRIEFSYYPKTPTWTGHPWTHLKLHGPSRHSPWTKHLVWGRIGVHVDTPDLDELQVCPHCGATTEERSSGDEGWTFCTEECGCLEGSETTYMTVREYENGTR